MDKDKFWAIIEKGVGKNHIPTLMRELNKLTPEEIISFQARFDDIHSSAYNWNIWGACIIGGAHCSDDGFTDFRYGLIALGREIFEKALDNPDSLVELDIPKINNESFGYVAGDIYKEKSGNDIYDNYPARIGACDDDLGEQWDFEDYDESFDRLPNITKKYMKK